MGNKQTKKKSPVKAQAKPAVSGGKSLDNVKRVLLLYKASTESSEAQDIVDHFCDALNQVKPPGCVNRKRKPFECIQVRKGRRQESNREMAGCTQ